MQTVFSEYLAPNKQYFCKSLIYILRSHQAVKPAFCSELPNWPFSLGHCAKRRGGRGNCTPFLIFFLAGNLGSLHRKLIGVFKDYHFHFYQATRA